MNINKKTELYRNTFRQKYKYITSTLITIYLQLLKKDLALHNTIFSALSCITLQSCTITIMYCVTMSPHV